MRFVASVLICALGATAFAAGPDAGIRAPPPRIWDIPRILDVVDAPGVTVVHGVPVTMRAIRSGDTVESLALNLRHQFAKAKLYIPPVNHAPRLLPDAVQLNAFDPETFIGYTVFLQANPDRTTTVILSEAVMDARQRRPKKDVRFAPLMTGAREVFTSAAEGFETAQYFVAATEQDVKSFYKDSLGRAKYSEIAPGEFRRGADLLRISTKAGPPGETAVIIVHRQAADGEEFLSRD